MSCDPSIPVDHSQLGDRVKHDLAFLLAQFEIEFPTEEACLAELYRIARIELHCHVCDGRNLEIQQDGRTGKCKLCNKNTWFTAGTFLDHMKKPKPRLAAIWLTFRGVILNSSAFSKLLNIAQSTAHDILKWTRFAIQNHMPGDAPLVHSSLFSSVFCKRSRETPARSHPLAEQDAMEKMTLDAEAPSSLIESGNTGNNSTDVYLDLAYEHSLDKYPTNLVNNNLDVNKANTDSESCNQEEMVWKLLSEAPLHFDVLLERAKIPVSTLSALLVLLELDGKAERYAGNMYVRLVPKPKITSPNQEASAAITAFLDFVRANFGGISRKYLQSYLAVYWCYIAGGQRSNSVLLQTCFHSLPIDNVKIRAYVSPIWVKLCM